MVWQDEGVKTSKSQTPNTKKPPTTKRGRSTTQAVSVPPAGVYPKSAPAYMLLHEEAAAGGQFAHPFDFEERSAKFGEAIIQIAKKIPRSPVNDRLISQLVGSGTSIGANFQEANDCVSKKDFRYTVKRCIKEGKEARYFLRMVATAEPSLAPDARTLYREASELIRILAAMWRK